MLMQGCSGGVGGGWGGGGGSQVRKNLLLHKYLCRTILTGVYEIEEEMRPFKTPHLCFLVTGCQQSTSLTGQPSK